MSDLINGIKANTFVIVGRAGMDFFADPAGTKTEEGEIFRAGLGGSSANIAAGICKLGGQAALVTRVSDDSVGRYCVNQLKHYGVNADYVTPIGGEFRNSLAVYESRIEDHQSVIYRNGAADFQMDITDVEAVDYTKYGALITAGTVFAAEPSRAATFHCICTGETGRPADHFRCGLSPLFMAFAPGCLRRAEPCGGGVRYDCGQ